MKFYYNVNENGAELTYICKHRENMYAVVFTSKYGRKAIYNYCRSSLGKLFHRLCSRIDIQATKRHLTPDHIVNIPSRINISSFCGLFKTQEYSMVIDKHINLRL
ncbi:transposase [Streptococcus ovuberis]|uniref:Transposase IS200-like domain-containing protein n=1 Tax=Streptococcus ovuberis TaxID=1936207 RepID=A0A7X6MYS2_9STRE|nr:hypothetical protein [Streptococcus ovuberis]